MVNSTYFWLKPDDPMRFAQLTSKRKCSFKIKLSHRLILSFRLHSCICCTSGPSKKKTHTNTLKYINILTVFVNPGQRETKGPIQEFLVLTKKNLCWVKHARDGDATSFFFLNCHKNPTNNFHCPSWKADGENHNPYRQWLQLLTLP